MIERFSDDTPHDGSFVIKAAALELQRRGTPLWIGADLSPAALCRREGDCSITGFLGDTAVAAMVRSDWDPEHLPELKKVNRPSFISSAYYPPIRVGGELSRCLSMQPPSRRLGASPTRDLIAPLIAPSSVVFTSLLDM